MISSIKNCCFDLYGTLADIHTEEAELSVWQKVREEILLYEEGCQLSSEELRKCFFEGQEYIREKDEANKKEDEYIEIDMKPIFSHMLSLCGIIPMEERVAHIAHTFRMASIEYCRLYPGAKEFLLKLKEQGIHLYLVTNAQRIFTFSEIEYLGIKDIFDEIYISSDYGHKKPDVRFFNEVIQRENLDLNSTVMIGNDGTCDIEGAKKAGLKTIYFHTNISPENDRAQADLNLEGADYQSAFQWIIG